MPHHAQAETDEVGLKAPKLVFVCSGHGSQWLGMAVELMAEEATFRRVLHECSRAVEATASWSVT